LEYLVSFIKLGGKINGNCKLILESKVHFEQIALPDYQNSPRCTSGGKEVKAVKVLGIEFPDELKVKRLPFSFLETHDVAYAFLNFIPDGIPFLSEFRPLIFQQRTFHKRLLFIKPNKKRRNKVR